MPRMGKYRGGNRDLEHVARDAEAVKLRAEGLNYQQIADRLGWANKTTAYRSVERALKDILVPGVEELRKLEAERLDELRRKAYEVLTADHVVTQHGRIVTDDDGQPVKDHEPVLKAIDRLLKVSVEYRKLFGIDAPVKADITVHQVDVEDLALMEIIREAQAANAAREAQLKNSIPGEIVREDKA
jgi:hypothetical protein